MSYILDTNTVIYYLKKQLPEKAEKFIDSLVAKKTPYLSVITEMELLCWNGPKEDMESLKNFIDDTRVIELEKDIKFKTIEIRRSHKIKLPDAIIAATAIVRGFSLLTRDTYHFKNVSGLELQNPWEQ
jgi:predicted nucleic acid-binding protein